MPDRARLSSCRAVALEPALGGFEIWVEPQRLGEGARRAFEVAAPLEHQPLIAQALRVWRGRAGSPMLKSASALSSSSRAR